MFHGHIDLDTATPVQASAIPDVLFERGLYWASGRSGVVNLVAAHKWFNLAALKGRADAIPLRREVAELMSEVEIAIGAARGPRLDHHALSTAPARSFRCAAGPDAEAFRKRLRNFTGGQSLHLTSLAHLGFRKMMPNDRGIEMLRFSTRANAPIRNCSASSPFSAVISHQRNQDSAHHGIDERRTALDGVLIVSGSMIAIRWWRRNRKKLRTSPPSLLRSYGAAPASLALHRGSPRRWRGRRDPEPSIGSHGSP